MTSAWVIDPRVVELAGNNPTPVPPDLSNAFDALSSGPPNEESPYVERLSTGQDFKRVITPHEISSLMQLRNEGPESWELLKDYSKVTIHRYRNRDLFNGCIFIKIAGHLPRCPKELVAFSIWNHPGERAEWDKQVYDFQLYPAPAHNHVVYCKMAAVPIPPRDFVSFGVFARHVDGNRLMYYMRSADNSLVPPGNRPRGYVFCNAFEIQGDPAGGTHFCGTIVCDPSIPVVPKWFMGLFVPNETRKWITNLEKHCHKLLQAGVDPGSLPTAGLFSAAGASLPRSPKAAGSVEAARHQFGAVKLARGQKTRPSLFHCCSGISCWTQKRQEPKGPCREQEQNRKKLDHEQLHINIARDGASGSAPSTVTSTAMSTRVVGSGNLNLLSIFLAVLLLTVLVLGAYVAGLQHCRLE